MAIVLDSFIWRLTFSLESFSSGEGCAMLGVRDDTLKLLNTMSRIHEIATIGERNRLENPQIDTWISEVKDAIYEIDDIIDLLVIEGGRILVEDQPATPPPSSVKCSLNLFACFKKRAVVKFCHEIVFKIRELNNRLGELEESSSQLINADPASSDSGIEKSGVGLGGDFCGRSLAVGKQVEKARNGIVDSLLKGSKKKVLVFGVVGTAGIGKTTLAREIFDDERVKENFPIRVWVRAKNLNELTLLREIIKGAGVETGEETESKAELIGRLGSSLSKRFFIVLDDLYEPGVWHDLLKNPLGDGVARGRVLITTRDASVLREINVSRVHNVERMNLDDGWEMLCTEIFENFNEGELSFLKEIGVKIIEKCDGLPIAIKVVAGLLRMKEKSQGEWEKVLESKSWSLNQLPEELSGALYFSYEDLPAHLKQCFLYCSLYPEEYLINKFHLIRHWIAEGLVSAEKNDGKLVEDLAEECYRELIKRNLLQTNPDKSDFCWITHGLLRSLARFLITDESVFLDGGQRLIVSLLKPRRLVLSHVEKNKNSLEDPISVKQQRSLRNILLFSSPGVRLIDDSLLRTTSSLRVLDLSGTELESLPNSIGNLTHLRYLNLDGTKIRDLPALIGYLINLQTLSLRDCKSLQRLPKTITALFELRCLCLNGTPISHIPKGIRNLSKLNHLDGFIIGHNMDHTEGCTLDEIHALSELRFLDMEYLERVNTTNTGSFALANKAFLKDLSLCWEPPLKEEEREIEDGEDGEESEEGEGKVDIFEMYKEEPIKRNERDWSELYPPPSIEKLVLKYYPEQEFPNWLMTSKLCASFPNLAHLELFNSPSCTQIPPFGLLSQLKWLRISHVDSVTTIGPEFLGTDLQSSFPKLESLSLNHMPNLKEWTFGETETPPSSLFPNLKSLEIQFCTKLKSLPKGLGNAKSLRILRVESAHSLTEIKDFPYLTDELLINDNKGLIRVSNLSNLKTLTIDDCSKLKHVTNLNSLEQLRLVYPPSTETFYFEELIIFWSIEFPQWLSNLLNKQHFGGPKVMNNLKKFELYCSIPLLKSCMDGGKNWQIIQQIPEVRVTSNDGKWYIRYSKNRRIYETNVGSEE